MSVCDKFFGCLNGDVDVKTVIKALSVVDAAGNQAFNICYTDRASCEGLEMAFDCNQEVTMRDILELIVGQDDCGRPVLNILANICETCTALEDEEEEQVVELP